jgi:hypothetical protein
VKLPAGWMRGEDIDILGITGRTYQNPSSNLQVLVTREPRGWHMSISHPTRYPKWDEIKRARYWFVPDEVTMAQLLPPRAEFVNIHENCFHLWEIKG